MEIEGVRMDVPSSQPVVVLREADGSRYLPIWVGSSEATSIVFAVQGLEPPRPLTHDLLLSVASSFGRTLERVRVHLVEDTVFHASLVFDDGTVVDSRASDAIALAVRVDCPVLCADSVLETAGLIMTADGELRDPADAPAERAEPASAEEADQEVREFRDFLDTVDPEDFQG
ncbi:bifunctional nuclease family protein [Kocuria palustris]|uniref:bifunctional nuclease family protein n=1 Tax=Kocuria palustris TaxID=71999 RepID=UPI0011A4877C|nr:bifunctional nuclease family protein [Kocuria palustris]